MCAPQVPAPASASCRPPEATGEALRREIEELRQKELALDQEIAQLMSEYVPGSAMPALFGGFNACCALVVRAKGVCGGAVLVPVLLRVGFSVGLLQGC